MAGISAEKKEKKEPRPHILILSTIHLLPFQREAFCSRLSAGGGREVSEDLWRAGENLAILLN